MLMMDPSSMLGSFSSSSGCDNKVFIGGLPPQTTQESLASYLSQYGQITECKVVMDLTTGRSKGYGFVVYATPQEAAAAVTEGYLTVDGKRCNCNLASIGSKKDANNINKKRSFSGTGTETFTTYGSDSTYTDNYTPYQTPGFDKRQRTDTTVGLITHPGYPGMPVTGVAPGIDLQNFQNFQMHMNSSITTMYSDIQSIKYEITMMSQNINSLKATLMAMKAGVDALCARQGLVISSTSTFH
eukprot:TRINITY_DN17941_c0_g1_i1.p1 TRINITY_DN17941_c0_g1~~TRINITY_DN17941_c0_g1_i1.p1  ORF type:complete len:242 (-),score=47.96 TRINITY_DN17941_c0_g1_i1:63-788(-)